MSVGPQPAFTTAGTRWSGRRRGRGASSPATSGIHTRIGERVARWGPLVALGAMVVAFSFTADGFSSLDNMRSILDSASVLAVLTVGLTFVLLMGAIDLSIEGVIATCSMSFGLLVMNSRNDYDLGLFAVVIAIGLGAAFGFTTGALSTTLKVPTFMTTVGMSSVGLGIGSLLFAGNQPAILDPAMFEWVSGRWFGFTRFTYLALVCVLVGVVLQFMTRFGRYASAIGSAEEIIGLSGVKVRRYKILAFAIAGAFYGLGAVMNAVYNGVGAVNDAQGENFAAITAAVVGGTLLSGGQGGVLHSMVGVLIVKVLENGLLLMGVSPYVQDAVQGVVVVVAVAAATWPLRQRMRVVK